METVRSTSFDTTDITLGMGHESRSEQIDRMPSGTKHNEVYFQMKVDRADADTRSGISMIKYVESMAEL